MTKTEMAKVLGWLDLACNSRREITENMVLVYANALRHHPYELVMAAAERHASSSPHFPALADLVRHIADLRSDFPTAEQAWEDVMRAVRNWGFYRPWKFENPITQAAVDAITKDTICMSESIGVERAHFFRIYESYREREVKAAREAALLGKPHESTLPLPRQPMPTPREERPLLTAGEVLADYELRMQIMALGAPTLHPLILLYAILAYVGSAVVRRRTS